MSEKVNKLLNLTEQEQEILQAIRSVQYGSILVVIHSAEIVQIERTNKKRFNAAQAVRWQVQLLIKEDQRLTGPPEG